MLETQSFIQSTSTNGDPSTLPGTGETEVTKAYYPLLIAQRPLKELDNTQPSPFSMISAVRGGHLEVTHSGSGGLGRVPEEANGLQS